MCHQDMGELKGKGVGDRSDSAELELKQCTMDASAHPECGMDVSNQASEDSPSDSRGNEGSESSGEKSSEELELELEGGKECGSEVSELEMGS